MATQQKYDEALRLVEQCGMVVDSDALAKIEAEALGAQRHVVVVAPDRLDEQIDRLVDASRTDRGLDIQVLPYEEGKNLAKQFRDEVLEPPRTTRPRLTGRRHDWRLDRAAQQWVCKHCSAELPNTPAGRAQALENRRCDGVDRHDVHDDLYRLHRSRGLLGGLIGAALAVGAAERRW